ncbi:MAG: hypothetical protein JOZ01_03775, partial [Candidatus Eremiobacteraeota bacterium]|nr:hypothetical protein [Candidatus Eremiobacteraeota bacterium]
MSRFFTARHAVFLALIVALGIVATVFPAQAATTGLVRGTITVDGKPASGASVTLQGEGSKFSTKTDATGAYVFSTVPYGT